MVLHRCACSVSQRLAGEVVEALGDPELVGHEVVEADVDRPFGRDDVPVVHERVQHPLQAVGPRCRDLVHRHRRTVHPRGVGEHRKHRQHHRHRVAVGAHHDDAWEDGVEHRQLLEMLG